MSDDPVKVLSEQEQLETMPAGKMNLTVVGDQLFRIPLVAKQLGHENASSTGTLMHPSSAEGRFVHDVVYELCQGKMSTREFCEKWYGSDEGALLLSRRIWERGEA
jgi:hypothetical protein